MLADLENFTFISSVYTQVLDSDWKIPLTCLISCWGILNNYINQEKMSTRAERSRKGEKFHRKPHRRPSVCVYFSHFRLAITLLIRRLRVTGKKTNYIFINQRFCYSSLYTTLDIVLLWAMDNRDGGERNSKESADSWGIAGSRRKLAETKTRWREDDEFISGKRNKSDN